MSAKTLLPARDVSLLDNALRAFTRTTGLPAVIVQLPTERRVGPRPDAAIKIEANGRQLQLLAEIKAIDRAVALGAAKHHLETYGKPGILIAPYLTPELADQCRQKLDLNFIDTAGNTYIRAPGLFVFVRGQRAPGHQAAAMGSRRGGTATALRVLFALLCKPELVNAPYRDIVTAAGVALGAVGWVFFDLQQRGYIIGGLRNRDRRLLERTRLVDEWVTNFPMALPGSPWVGPTCCGRASRSEALISFDVDAVIRALPLVAAERVDPPLSPFPASAQAGAAANRCRQRLPRRPRDTQHGRLLPLGVTHGIPGRTFPIKLRPKLNPRRFHAPDPGWWRQARLEPGARWGGEVAAARLTNYLKPAASTIYLAPQHGGDALTTLVKRHRLRADPNGNVEVLDAFWYFEHSQGTPPDLVPPLLVYADLMATLDPRNLEVAKRIRAEYLEDALSHA